MVYDGDTIVAELDANGNPVVEYAWGLLGPIARLDLTNSANNRYYISDALGHTRLLLDSTGGVKDTYVYDAWGNLLKGSDLNTPNPFTWNGAYGYEWLEFTGLFHVGAREYDPRTARWLQRDPIGVGGGHPNVYLYCGNEPVNAKDPSGLQNIESVRASITEAFRRKAFDEAIGILSSAVGAFTQKQTIALILFFLRNPTMQERLKGALAKVGSECSVWAKRVYDVFTEFPSLRDNASQLDLKIYYMQANVASGNGPTFISLANKTTVTDGGVYHYHVFLRLGDVVLDDLTGPKGQAYSEWVKRWVDGKGVASFEKAYRCIEVSRSYLDQLYSGR